MRLLQNSNRLLEAYASAPRAEHPESKVREDISASQNEVPWVFTAIFFAGNVKVLVILVGAAGADLGLTLLLQWYHGNRATGKASSSYPCYCFFRLYGWQWCLTKFLQ